MFMNSQERTICFSWIYEAVKKLNTNVIKNLWNIFTNYKDDEPNENRGEISVDYEENDFKFSVLRIIMITKDKMIWISP